MTANRSSVKNAEHKLILLKHKERIARDIAFEAGAVLDVADTSVSVIANGHKELLCAVQDPHDLWPKALKALCSMYPHLARQS
jgi:hypothetical protein